MPVEFNFNNVVWPSIPERFRMLGEMEYIGSGSTSKVYRISGAGEYALKVISCGKDRRLFSQALREIDVMKNLDHCGGIVRLYDSEVVSEGEYRTVYLLEECCTPVADYLRKNHVRYVDLIRMMLELSDVLIQCRNAGILHLDIKPQNLLINKKGVLCLGDFSSSLQLREVPQNKSARGTLSYMAPEVFRCGECSEQSDIYSVGMVLYRLLEGTVSGRIRHDDELKAYKRLAGAPLPILTLTNAVFAEEVMGCIGNLCAFERKDRIKTFEELQLILQHLLVIAEEIPASEEEQMVVFIDPVAISVAMSVAHSVAHGKLNNNPTLTLQGWIEGGTVSGIFEVSLGGNGGQTINARSKIDEIDLAAEERKKFRERLLHGGDYSTLPNDSHEQTFLPLVDSTMDHPLIVPPGRLAGGDPICRTCAHRIPDYATYCPHCGTMQQVEKPTVCMQKIQISALAPKKFIKGDYSMVDVVLYEEAYRHVVDALKSEDVGEKMALAKVAEDSEIRVCLMSPDLEIEDNVQQMQWCGGYLDFGFGVYVPNDYAKRSILFNARIYINDVLASRITFTAKCHSLRAQKMKLTRSDVLSAFVSYAREDMDDVLRVIQGMRKARPDMEVFWDVEGLRSGEDWRNALYSEIDNRDMLVLCWSRRAKVSEWVDKEWRYAFKQKGIEGIDPIPLEPPEVCPPPDELSKMHFNDSLLYMRNQLPNISNTITLNL